MFINPSLSKHFNLGAGRGRRIWSQPEKENFRKSVSNLDKPDKIHPNMADDTIPVKVVSLNFLWLIIAWRKIWISSNVFSYTCFQALRIRPISTKEIENGCAEVVSIVPGRPQVSLKDQQKCFTYDYAYESSVGQAELYEDSVKPLIEKLFKGNFWKFWVAFRVFKLIFDIF